MLHQYIPNEFYMLHYDIIELDDPLTYIEESVGILARDVRQLYARCILVIKV